MSVAPPRPKSIPLTALRAFESAARLGGFAAAADELGVSAGAISAHIKAIESEVGAPLFKRSPQGVQLTALGARIQPEFTQAFDAMGQAIQTLRAEAGPRVVHIAALPAVAQFWLSPRLPKLRAAAPEIAISITALEAPPNLKRTPYDLCLFYGADQGEIVAEDWVFPVCAPSVAKRLTTPEDLRLVPCLTDSGWPEDWAIWSAKGYPGGHFAPRGPVFSLYSLAVEETINGAGVLIGHDALIGPYLKTGSLVAPFKTRARLNRQLRLWTPRPTDPKGPIGLVSSWLKRQG